MTHKGVYQDRRELGELLKVARGDAPADLVFKNVQFVDVFTGALQTGDVAIHGQTIVGIQDSYAGRQEIDAAGCTIVPGFIDAHVHIESSMMTPVRFQESVLPCGTTAVIWDPHEIANVKGAAGIQWALEASEGLDLDVFVMVPSCVPSTPPALEFETSGATLSVDDLAPFRNHPRVLGLAEMMNFPGLIHGDADVVAKLDAFRAMRRDGHCPGLTGKDLNAYGVAGIHSCHESTTLEEAAEKLSKGIHVLVREGSCAKDAATLLPILTGNSSPCVSLCSDDRNPLDIQHEGHISFIIDMALRQGIEPAAVFRAASFAPARMFGLMDRGAIAPGYRADLVLVKPRQGGAWNSGMQVETVYKSGRRVDASSLSGRRSSVQLAGHGPNLRLSPPTTNSFRVPAAADSKADSRKAGQSGTGTADVRVIGVRPGQILTDAIQATLPVVDGAILADMSQDVLKIAVLERHHGTGRIGLGFVRGFGLRQGAIATSINHDSHNVIVVGADDRSMSAAVEALLGIDGGIAVVDGCGTVGKLSLPLGGLMTDAPPTEVAETLAYLKSLTRKMGCPLAEPFLTLSFLALPVIPQLKITDRGLVDVVAFQRVDVCL